MSFTKGASLICDKVSLVASLSTLKHKMSCALYGGLPYMYPWAVKLKDLRLNIQLLHWIAMDTNRN